VALLAAALFIVAMPAAPATAKKHKRKFRGLVLTSVSKKKGGSVRPPTTIQANIGISNPNRRKAPSQPISVTLGSAATNSAVTPFLRRRSSTTFGIALTLPAGTPAAKYTLAACLGGKVFPGTSRCASAKSKVNVLATKVSLAISPASKAFGDVPINTDSPQQPFTISNQSLVQSTVPSVTISGIGFQIASNGCTAAIPPGGVCSVAALFHPTATGAQSGSLKVTASGDTASASLTGKGV
jgi:hypothetical protein